jgi:predicted CDP-diglyceride synthetase/phosphatidate cytidylyltransferase
MAGVLYAVILAAVAVAGSAWILVALGASLVFCVANPLACALRQAWWRETLVSGVLFLGTLFLYSILDGMGAIRLREDSMVFAAPVIFYFVAVPVSGVIRLIRWRRAAARPGPASPAV